MNTKHLLRPCPICHCTEGEVLHTQKFIVPDDFLLPKEYDVAACQKCGFVYADTAANQQTYDAFYTLQSKYEDKTTGSGGGYSDYDLQRISDTADEIARACPSKTARIIDIGCANGGLLKQLKDKGYTNLTGYDPSAKCAATVKEQGIDCVQGSLFEADKVLQGRQFDCVILSHVAEHICDLQGAFGIFHALLCDGGRLYVEVPDAARYADFYVAAYSYFDKEHINHFDAISLSNAGVVNGFSAKHTGRKVIPVSTNQFYPAVFVVFEKNNVGNTVRLAMQAVQSIKRYLEISDKECEAENNTIAELVKSQEKIYVFGAGSFTHRLLANTDLPKCNIAAFLDNDKNKTMLKNVKMGGGGG